MIYGVNALGEIFGVIPDLLQSGADFYGGDDVPQVIGDRRAQRHQFNGHFFDFDIHLVNDSILLPHVVRQFLIVGFHGDGRLFILFPDKAAHFYNP